MKNLKSFARVGKRGGKRQQWQLQRNQQKESCECSYLGPITRKRAREINLEDEEPSCCCSYEQQPSLFTRTPASPQSCNSSETTEHPEMSTNSDVSEVETVDMKMDTSTSTSRRRRSSLRSSKKHKTEEEAQQRQRQRRRESAATTTTPSSKVGSPSSSSPLDLIENFLGRCESQARKKQKDLADKYNYDFEKDMPARGNKFEWTQVKS